MTFAGSSDTATVEFTGSSGVLEINQASTAVGAISGFGSGDVIELKGFDKASAESVANDVLTIQDGSMSQTFSLESATYTTAQFGVIQLSDGFDYLSLQTNIVGGGHTLDLAGGSASVAGLSNTAGDFDAAYGSNGTVDLASAQAVVVGGGDSVGFVAGTGNAVTVSGTAGVFDAVYGAWNTVHIARIVDQLRAAGHEVRDEDVARVSPLAHAHVIPNGSYFQSPRRRVQATPQSAMA